MNTAGKKLLLVMAVVVASVAVNSTLAQNNFANLWGLYGFSRNFSMGLSYNYSNISHCACGFDVRYRWLSFGVEADLGNKYHEIPIGQLNIDSIYTVNYSDGITVDYQSKYNKVMPVFHCLVRGEVYLKHFSLGCSYGFSILQFYNVDMDTENERIGRFAEYYMFLRPYLGGHIPLYDERLFLSLRVGYDIGLYDRVIKDGISLGFGISISL